MQHRVFASPLPGGPLLARLVQVALAGAGIAVMAVGLYRLPEWGLSRNELAVGLLLVLVLSMQFLLAAMIFPLTNCLLRRGRRLPAEPGAAPDPAGM
jgi:hypothetical protein